MKNEQGGVHVFTGSKDGHWRMWNAQSWTLEQDVQMEGEIHALTVEAGFLVCGYEGPTPTIPGVNVGLVRAWNLANPNTPFNFAMSDAMPFAHLQRVYAIKMLVGGATPEIYTGGHEGEIHCWGWDGAGFKLTHKLEGHVKGVTCLSGFASAGRPHLLSGSMDKTIRLWDVATKQSVGMLTKNNDGHGDSVTCVAPLKMADVEYFMTGAMDGLVKVWNGQGGCDFSQKCAGAVLSLDATLDAGSKTIVLCGLVDGTVELRQPDAGFKLRATLSNRFSVGHTSEVRGLCCGEGYFCSVGADSKLMVWQWVAPLP